LGHDPDASFDVSRVRRRVHPEHVEQAGRAAGAAVDHLHRRRLTGAVDAQEAEALARGDREVDAAHGDHVTVPFCKTSRRNGRPFLRCDHEPAPIRAAPGTGLANGRIAWRRSKWACFKRRV
jgi:hypothetical protein